MAVRRLVERCLQAVLDDYRPAVVAFDTETTGLRGVVIQAALVELDAHGREVEVFEGMVRQGFVRARVDGEVMDLREIAKTKAATPFTTKTQRYQKHTVEAVVDRICAVVAEVAL